MRLRSALAASAMLAFSLCAHADTYQQFNIAPGANFYAYNYSGNSNVTQTAGTLGGSLVIDTTTGSVYSSALTFSLAQGTFSRIGLQEPEGAGYTVPLYNANNDFLHLVFETTSLVNYAGGQLCPYPENSACLQTVNTPAGPGSVGESTFVQIGGSSHEYDLEPSTAGNNLVVAGPLVTITPVVTATPEPSSLLLLGTGIVAVIGAARRRFA